MNEEWLAEALEAAVDARIAYENNPSTEAGFTNFDFERVYSETAKQVFDGTFWAYPGEYEKP